MDSVLMEAERLLLTKNYVSAVDLLRTAQASSDPDVQHHRRRLLAWATLSTGDTKTAYELFWSCAHHPGARAGILLLTVLAGQVETAVSNWVRYCEKLKRPPTELPDHLWHTPAVVLPALELLEGYPFREKSQEFGAISVYKALLYQTQSNAPGTFKSLGRVTSFYAPARLLRDLWMDELLCLPLPKEHVKEGQGEPESVSSSGSDFAQRQPEEVIARANYILLYPDIDVLESHCEAALREGRFTDALEALRRLLFLDPQHTPSLEKRWRLYLKLEEREASKQDLFFLMDVYEKEKQIVACQKVAAQLVELFPDDERALLKMCFLQARLGAPTRLAQYGKQLLALCRQQGLTERANSYRRWLLRQNLSLDDRTEFEVS